MRILVCSHAFPPDPGGVAAFTHDVVCLLRHGGHQVHVVHEGKDAGLGPCRPVGRLMHRWRRRRLGILWRFVHFLCAVLTFRPHLVISSSWAHFGWPAVLFAPLLRYRVILQVHGTEIRGRFRQGRWHRLLMRVLRSADMIWPNSHFTAELLISYGCAQEKLRIFHPFLSQELLDFASQVSLEAPRPDPPLIFTAAHLYPRKGIDIVLRALAQVQDLPWHYVIAGEEPRAGYRNRYETLARELGLAERVAFVGQLSRQEVWEYMARASLFVLASRPDPNDIESFGIVYIEAQALGAVCVAAQVGGVPDAIGDAGVLVPPEAPDALASALRALLTHPQRLQELRQRGRERITAHFTEAARRAEITPWLESLS